MNKSVISLLGVAALAGAAAWFWMGAAKPLATSSLPTELTKPVPASETKTTPSKLATTPAVTSNPNISAEAQRQCRQVFALTNATARKATFDKMLAGITDAAGIKGVLEVMNEMFKSGRRFDAEWDTFWHVIAHRDPKATVALIESYGSKERWYIGAVSRTLQEWASTDPQAAMQWLEGNQAITGEDMDTALVDLIKGYAAKDLTLATAYGFSIFDSGESMHSVIGFALVKQAIQQGGVTGLKDWFNSLPSDVDRHAVFDFVCSNFGEVDIQLKRSWLEAEAGKPYRNEHVYFQFISDLAKEDPKSALEFGLKLPRSSSGWISEGVAGACAYWLMEDESAFELFYRTLSTTKAKETVVEAVHLSLRDPFGPPTLHIPAKKFLEAIK